MTTMESFVIDFYTTVVNNSPVTTISTPAITPNSSSITTSIEKFVSYLESNKITINNIAFVRSNITDIENLLKKFPEYNTFVAKLKETETNTDGLIANLKILINKIKTTSSTTPTTIEDVTEPSSGTAPAKMPAQKTKRVGGLSTNTEFVSISTKITNVETNIKGLAENYSSFITKINAAFTSLSKGTSTIPPRTTDTTKKQKVTVSAAVNNNNNIINNIAKFLVGNRNAQYIIGTRPQPVKSKKQIETTPQIVNISSFQPYSLQGTVTSSQTSVEKIATDYYEVSTSIRTDYIVVLFSYYPANSTTSSFACTFCLNIKQLAFLSGNAFKKIIAENAVNKAEAVDNSGVSGSTTPGHLWNSYLIWVYSYLSFCVASQLGFGIFPSVPKRGDLSVNYMLAHEYMQKIGNCGITLSSSTMSSTHAALLKVAIPHNWPRYMYSYNNNTSMVSEDEYLAKTIVTTINKYMGTIKTTM